MYIFKQQREEELTFKCLDQGETFRFTHQDSHGVGPVWIKSESHHGKDKVVDMKSGGIATSDFLTKPVIRISGFFHPCTPSELEAVKSGKLVPILVPANADIKINVSVPRDGELGEDGL